MHIREAIADDNQELQNLQAKCPQGTTLIVSAVNTPDFFARAKAYRSYKIFVACQDNRIIGSAACAIRQGILNGNISRVGYEFQYFTSPDYRRAGIGKQLHQHIANYFTEHGVVLSSLFVMEGNHPAVGFFEGQGFKLHRTLTMPGLVVHKDMAVAAKGKVRQIVPEDLVAVARLLNETWQGFELYEPTSADALAELLSRTQGHSLDNLLVLEDRGEFLACLGFCDWSQITRVTVKALSLKMRLTGLLLNFVRLFRSMPRFLKPGDTLKQMVLTPIGFKRPAHLAVLVRHMNNKALLRGIEQMFCICEQDHPLLRSMKGFMRVDTEMYLYVKCLGENVVIDDKPVFLDGIDL